MKMDMEQLLISGTVREQKLYNQFGFEPFADPVGTEEAKFIPMVLTRDRFDQFSGLSV